MAAGICGHPESVGGFCPAPNRSSALHITRTLARGIHPLSPQPGLRLVTGLKPTAHAAGYRLALLRSFPKLSNLLHQGSRLAGF